MKIFNPSDYNPHNLQLPSNDFFSFLDGEIYCIGSVENSKCSKYLKISSETGIITFDNFNRSEFIFQWVKNGYHICSAENPDRILTLSFSTENGSYFVSMERNQNRTDQLWDIVPYNGGRSGYGLSFRTSAFYGGTYMYISANNYRITLTKEPAAFTNLMLCPLNEEWITFGMACMQYLKWIYVTDSDVSKAIRNYYTNMLINLSQENIFPLNENQIIVNQSGGNFSKLQFADVSMNDVACEAIAVCNAIRILNESFAPDNSDFFRIAAEFEISGLYENSFKTMLANAGSAFGIKKLSSIKPGKGSFGGDPDKIKNFLESRKIQFRTIHINDKSALINKNKRSENSIKLLDEGLKDAACAVVSYNFDTLHQAIHTFACIPFENGKVRAFNKFSNHTLNGNYLNTESDRKRQEIYESCSEAVSETKESRFYSACLLYRV